MPMLTQSQYNALLPFLSGPYHRDSPGKLPDVLAGLQELGYIDVFELGVNDMYIGFPISWRITPAGRIALEAFEEQRKRDAEKKRQDDLDRAQRITDRKKERRDKWLICLVSTCGGSILTLLIEHFDEIVAAVVSLFS